MKAAVVSKPEHRGINRNSSSPGTPLALTNSQFSSWVILMCSRLFPSALVVGNMKPRSQQTLFNFPGRLSSECWPGPVHTVICTLVPMENVGVLCCGLQFDSSYSEQLNCQDIQVRFTPLCVHQGKQILDCRLRYAW